MILVSFFTILSLTTASATEVAAPTWQSKIIAEVESIYLPFAATQGLNLSFIEDTKNQLVVASAVNDDGINAKVVLATGLLTAPRLTPDALRMTICHELGHIFGGAPRRNVPGEWDGVTADDGFSIMTSEGQSDYYASMVCFPKITRGQEHGNILEKNPPRQVVKDLCASKTETEDNLICQRSLAASLDFLNTVIEFKISLSTPATEVATKLDRNTYPTRQCRLDILVAGSVCQSEFSLQLDRNDPIKSGCQTARGQRPVCWYPAQNL